MKISIVSAILVFGLIVFNSLAQSTQSFDSLNNSEPPKPYQVEYKIWEELLENHVNENGFVDYKGFKDNSDKLKKFTQHLENNTPQDHWTKDQKKAYLINAYNAYTVQLVIEHYPLESIKDIGGFLSNVFKKDFINFNDEMISLDDIEKGMLLPMGDPRVHFAVNCASFSCPKLDNIAYKPENLNQHLDQAAKQFINSQRNILSRNELKLSRIFKWYESDFERQNQSLIDFINQYSEIEIKSDASIDYLDYNWQLNSVKNAENS